MGVRLGLRHVGLAVTAIAVVTFFLLIWFLNELSDMSHASCTCGDTCQMQHFEVPPLFYVGLLGVCLLLLLGMLLLLQGGQLFGEEDRSRRWRKNVGKLGGEEQAVYQLIADADGTLFQSEIVEKTGLSKVKVTRTLDRLEAKQLVERRRHGLTNIVLLK